MRKTAIVFGASGLIGNLLIQKLLQDNRYQKIILIVRSSMNLKHDKLEEKIVDFNTFVQQISPIQADEIYCCIGTTIKKAGSKEAFEAVDLEIPSKIAQLAVINNIQKLLVISSLGANLHTSNFYLKTKAKMEHSMAKKTIDTVIFFRPSLLLGSRKEFRFGELMAKIFMPIMHIFLLGSLKKYRAIKAEVVAEVMINVANSDKEGLCYLESDEIVDLLN